MRTFQFQIVITEDCNLDCNYCYMNKNKNVMTKEVFEKHYQMLPKLMENYGADNYVAGYFGGEPLMNWNLIELTAPLFLYDKKCSSSFLATNGLALSPDRQRYLEKNKVGISISFDGLWNKYNRPLKSGISSFEKYMELRNILRIHSCKVMVSPNRSATMAENYKWFVEEFDVPSPDFTLVRDDIWTNEDVERFGEELTELTDLNIKYIKAGKESLVGFYGLYFMDTWFGKRYGKRQHGCFAGRFGAGFMPDGKVYPCARFGSSCEYPIWDSLTGRKIEHNHNMFINPYIYDPHTYLECNECSLFNYCNAGCTYSQLHYNTDKGREEICTPIPNVCKLFKMVYSEMSRIVDEVGETQTFKNIVYNIMRSLG